MQRPPKSRMLQCLYIIILSLLILSCKKEEKKVIIPVVETKSITGIAQTTAICGGIITSDGGGSINEKGVCWGTSPEPTILDSRSSDGTGADSFISNIKGLSVGLTHYARAYATNSAGTGYGESVEFKTLEIPTIDITTLEATDITETSAKVGGIISSDGGLSIISRGVCWSLNDHPSFSDNFITVGSGIGEFTATVNNLTAGKTYNMRAFATTNTDTTYGNQLVFITQSVLVPDGIYIKGAGTALINFDINGLMKSTRNETNQSERASLMEIFVAVKAGTDGFNIVKVIDNVQTSYGPGANFAVVGEADRTIDEPMLDFWRGNYTETTNPFTIPADGLYHVIIDTELGICVIVPVQYWGLIGAATPGGWSSDTQMPPIAFDLNTITYEVTDVGMTEDDFRLRYSGGWKVIIDPDIYIGDGVIGVKVNTNLGGLLDALEPGGGNFANETAGIYTAKMVWTLGTGYTATITKTGDPQLTDYSNTGLGFVGTGVLFNGVANDWNTTILVKNPIVTNETTYTWTYTGVEMDQTGSFKIREGQSWENLIIGYPQVVMAGTAANKFGADGDGNFVPMEDGVFDIVFEIDAVTEVYTFSVDQAGPVPDLFMLGDGCNTGWDNTAALPMTGTDGVYSITTTLFPNSFIKFITTLGEWTPMYGTDTAGTNTGGKLVFRPTGIDPDSESIPTPAIEGLYTVTADITNLTYTIAAK